MARVGTAGDFPCHRGDALRHRLLGRMVLVGANGADLVIGGYMTDR